MVVVQDPRELVLAVLADAPDPAPEVLAAAEVRHGPINATVQVIGASHLVGVQVDGHPWFHETLSCLPIPRQGCLYQHGFVDLADHDAELAAWGYRVRVRLSTTTGCPADTPGGGAGWSRRGDGLEVAFPPVFGQQPITRVAWEADDDGLTWTTLHTYPRPVGSTVVTSRSVLTTPSGRRGRRDLRLALP